MADTLNNDNQLWTQVQNLRQQLDLKNADDRLIELEANAATSRIEFHTLTKHIQTKANEQLQESQLNPFECSITITTIQTWAGGGVLILRLGRRRIIHLKGNCGLLLKQARCILFAVVFMDSR